MRAAKALTAFSSDCSNQQFRRDHRAVAAYKVPHTSYVVVIDRAGTVVYTGVGGEQNVAAAIAKAF